MLETKRLILRMPRVSDATDYLEFCNSEFVMRYNAMSPRTLEDVEKQFSTNQTENTLLLEHKTTCKVVGAVFIEEDSVRFGVESRELSYFIREEFSRKGYMKEALAAVIAYLFQNQSLECVAARAFTCNLASRRLLESLGFRQDGLIPRCVRGYQNTVFDDTLYSLFRKI